MDSIFFNKSNQTIKATEARVKHLAVRALVVNADVVVVSEMEPHTNRRIVNKTATTQHAIWGTDKPDHPVPAQPFGTLPWMPT